MSSTYNRKSADRLLQAVEDCNKRGHAPARIELDSILGWWERETRDARAFLLDTADDPTNPNALVWYTGPCNCKDCMAQSRKDKRVDADGNPLGGPVTARWCIARYAWQEALWQNYMLSRAVTEMLTTAQQTRGFMLSPIKGANDPQRIAVMQLLDAAANILQGAQDMIPAAPAMKDRTLA